VPIYAYRCPECGERFDLLRSYSRADDPAPCPTCAAVSERQIARFAAFAKGNGTSSAVGGGKSCGDCGGGSCASCR
jgi:putative FmdB family regulatory protein